MENNKLKSQYRIFFMADTYLEEARQFIDTLGPEKLIGVMSLQPFEQADQVVVWYWEDEGETE